MRERQTLWRLINIPTSKGTPLFLLQTKTVCHTGLVAAIYAYIYSTLEEVLKEDRRPAVMKYMLDCLWLFTNRTLNSPWHKQPLSNLQFVVLQKRPPRGIGAARSPRSHDA